LHAPQPITIVEYMNPMAVTIPDSDRIYELEVGIRQLD